MECPQKYHALETLVNPTNKSLLAFDQLHKTSKGPFNDLNSSFPHKLIQKKLSGYTRMSIHSQKIHFGYFFASCKKINELLSRFVPCFQHNAPLGKPQKEVGFMTTAVESTLLHVSNQQLQIQQKFQRFFKTSTPGGHSIVVLLVGVSKFLPPRLEL
mmetsp:Transcript_17022/g.27645  ORF Transcript_17022/g.27645 Transcript_17022/m.27645 type:complete len:157 (+) Transcript_17022:422-892(+)